MEKQERIERKETLKNQIEEIKKTLVPLEEELREIYNYEQREVESRIEKAERGHGDFEERELVYAAAVRCSCGAGFAYPKGTGIHGEWQCSSILLGKAERGSTHKSPMPFAFYEVKSENQPSANGKTTRPQK